MNHKKRIYIDMDGVLCDFISHWEDQKSEKNPFPHSQLDFFRNLEPLPNAIESYKKLEEHFDVWILTRPSVLNPLCYTEKRVWVGNHLGIETCYKLIISPDKSLLKGDYLIDDMPDDSNIVNDPGNVLNFEGEHIHFGSEKFPDWKSVLDHLIFDF